MAHDLFHFFKVELSDHEQVRVAKIASVVVGAVAIVLGILFQEMNVSYLVGWAFSVAASANLPSLVMLLFWKGTTPHKALSPRLPSAWSVRWGGFCSAQTTFDKVYGLPAESAIMPFSQPGIVTIPLGFLTLIVVSLMTQKTGKANGSE